MVEWVGRRSERVAVEIDVESGLFGAGKRAVEYTPGNDVDGVSVMVWYERAENRCASVVERRLGSWVSE